MTQNHRGEKVQVMRFQVHKDDLQIARLALTDNNIEYKDGRVMEDRLELKLLKCITWAKLVNIFNGYKIMIHQINDSNPDQVVLHNASLLAKPIVSQEQEYNQNKKQVLRLADRLNKMGMLEEVRSLDGIDISKDLKLDSKFTIILQKVIIAELKLKLRLAQESLERMRDST